MQQGQSHLSRHLNSFLGTRMFHRASSSAAIVGSAQQPQLQRQQQTYQNGTATPSQSTLVQHPLTPKTTSKFNTSKLPKNEEFTAGSNTRTAKAHVLLTTSGSSGNRTNKNQAVSNICLSDEDYGDDVFDFDPETPVAAKDEKIPSSVISWPPSSYSNPGERSPVSGRLRLPLEPISPSQHVQKSIKLEPKDLPIDHSSENCAPRESLNIQSRRPRTLPWLKDPSVAHCRPGVKAVPSRALSTSAALKEEEDDEESVASTRSLPIMKKDSYDMTQSAMKAAKAAIKSKSNTKKRSLEDMLKNNNQPSAGGEVARVFLSQEQRGVIDMLKTGKSVFFTGSAGTGKSVLLRSAIQELKQLHKQPENVAVTASTGLAACNIGGTTLHSFAGVGLGLGTADQLVKNVKKMKKHVVRWTKTKVLIIDEISMINADFFDKLEYVARKLKGVDKPWGGIQLVVTGDFFQLPPVSKDKATKFAFEAEKWKLLDATIQLKTVFRQKDEEFVTMLNEMRTGRMTATTIDNFKKLQRPVAYDDGLIPTELFPTRREVDEANAIQLRRLPSDSKVFDAEDSGTILDLEQRSKLLGNCMATDRLELKKGAQVMLIKNRDDGLVNGSLGVVMGFMNSNTYTFATDDEGNMASDDNIFRDSPWTDEELRAMSKSTAGKRKMQSLMEMSANSANQKLWPVVRFKSPNGGQDSTQLMTPETWKIELPNGEVQACRRQVPLILAYAISIHKSQGQTIERVKVNLQRIFEKGQAYVALSRAVSRNGLQIMQFDARKVMVHEKVGTFYRELADASDVVQQHISTSKPEVKSKVVKEKEHEDVFMSTQNVFNQIKTDPIKAYMGGKKTVGRMLSRN